MIDTTPIGKVSAETMEKISSKFEDAEDSSVRCVCIVVEIETEEGFEHRVFSDDDRPHVVLAIVHEAVITLERALDQAMERDE